MRDINVDMFGNILDNPKKNDWDTHLSRSQIYTNIPWWNNTPLNAFPARSRQRKKLSACAAGQIWWNMIIYFQSILSVAEIWYSMYSALIDASIFFDQH